jgi:aminopeptidase N
VRLRGFLCWLSTLTFSVSLYAAAPDLDLEVELHPASRDFRARARLYSPGELRFSLHRSLNVTAATANGHPAEVIASAKDGERRYWRVRSVHGHAVEIHYRGTLPPLDLQLDHRSVLQSRGPMAAAAGSFLPAGSGWYPEPASRFSYRVTLSLPADQRGLVAGRLLDEKLPADNQSKYQATFDFPHPAEGIDLMAGPYTVRERIVGGTDRARLRLRTYFLAGMEQMAEDYLADSQRYIELYSGLIGAYPFSEFSVVASPLPTGFGMPTLTYIGADALKLPFIRATSLGHEVLHNWWGNGVYVEYAGGNWSEGLTTFMADYYYREQQSAVAAREMRHAWLRDFAAVPEGALQPLSSFRARTHGAEAALGYGKAAMVFFMLRDEIGEEAFMRGIRAFWAAHRFKAASWDDLRAAFETSAGRSLQTFFTQWIHRAGGPAVEIEQAAMLDKEKSLLAIQFKQSAPPYAVRVPIAFADGHVATLLAEIHRERQTATFAVDAPPRAVRLDPDFRLWRRLEPEALPPILRQWIIARAPHVVILSRNTEIERAAAALARRFFESPYTLVEQPSDEGHPLLVIGLHSDVDRALVEWALPPRPDAVKKGSAQVWTVRQRGAKTPIALMSVNDAAALAALMQPLPHYGSQSYLAFDGRRVIVRGVWAAEVRTIPVR